MSNSKQAKRIVLTGGPGAGKTTAAALLRREVGPKIVVVPEAATMLFTSGFPRHKETFAIKATQKAIFHVQMNLEDVQSAAYPDRFLLCDRGTVDSSIYWPDGIDNFFQTIGSSLQEQFDRYDAVVFFETSAVANIDVEDSNPARNESIEESIKLDKHLREVWSQHKNFHFIPHDASFMKKIANAHQQICEIMSKL